MDKIQTIKSLAVLTKEEILHGLMESSIPESVIKEMALRAFSRALKEDSVKTVATSVPKKTTPSTKATPVPAKKTGRHPEIPVIDDQGNFYASLSEAAAEIGSYSHEISRSLKKGWKVKGRRFSLAKAGNSYNPPHVGTSPTPSSGKLKF